MKCKRVAEYSDTLGASPRVRLVIQIHTHGSYMEEKGTAMLWHYGNAEPEFGALQVNSRVHLEDDRKRREGGSCFFGGGDSQFEHTATTSLNNFILLIHSFAHHVLIISFEPF